MAPLFGHEHLLTDHPDQHPADGGGHDHLTDHHDGGWLHEHGTPHEGFGLHTAPAQLSHGWHVPWQQITPDAMTHDVDGDGIPDALDNRIGPGA